MNELLAAAHSYAAREWPVVPLHTMRGDRCSCGRADCRSPGKHPRTEHGLTDSSHDADQIDQWWAQWPDANVGLLTGVVFDVLDIDGDEGRASIRALLAQHELTDFAPGPRTKTGSGGTHILFKATGAGNKVGFLPKVDWRGRGGYIVAPPSLHASGHNYEWRTNPDDQLPSCPAWLLELVNPPHNTKPAGNIRPLPADLGDGTPYGVQALDCEIRELGRALTGTRNHALNACTFNLYQLVAGGELRETAVESRIRSTAAALGLGDNEIEQTLNSGRVAGLKSPRNAPELSVVYGAKPTSSVNGNLALNSQAAPMPTQNDSPVVDQALLDIVKDEYGITGPEAWRLADQLGARLQYERSIGLARRIIRDEQLEHEADLASIIPINVADLLDRPRELRIPLFGQLMAEGHNATIVARWKVGKSTFVDNAAIAAATGGMFLGRFETPQPLRVVLFNYELHEDDMSDRLADYNITSAAAANISVVNLRGRRLPLTVAKGRDTAVRILDSLGAQLWIVDPFGAAFAAAGGQEENNNAEVRRFLIALDEIKRLARCASLLMPVHTGRRTDAEGDEQGRGATVLEDWPDVRMLLTRGQKEQHDYRFIRTEGRAWELDESRLTFEPGRKHLSLEGGDMGVSRSRARDIQNAHIVRDVVAEEPGANARRLVDLLADAGISNNDTKAKATKTAKETGLVHFHRDGSSQRHYIGAQHPDSDPCPGGFTQ